MIYKKKISKRKINDKIVGNIIFLFPTIIAIIIQKYSIKYILILISTFIICELIGIIISFLIDRCRTPKSTYNFEYYREYGFDSPPAVVARLLQKDITDENDLFATVLDLYIKGYINIDNATSSNIRETLQNTSDLQLSLNTTKNINDLLPYEKYLVEWIFANSNTTSMNYISLKDTLKKDLYSGNHFEKWKSLVEQEYYWRQYVKEDTSTQNLIELLAIPVVFLFVFPFITIAYTMPVIVFIITTIILTICSRIMLNTEEYPLTEKGIDELQKIKGYIRFIKEYSLMKDASSKSVIIWNQYLTYSIALNLTQTINKELKKILGEELYIIKEIY